jgi:hypothetical protein
MLCPLSPLTGHDHLEDLLSTELIHTIVPALHSHFILLLATCQGNLGAASVLRV